MARAWANFRRGRAYLSWLRGAGTGRRRSARRYRSGCLRQSDPYSDTLRLLNANWRAGSSLELHIQSSHRGARLYHHVSFTLSSSVCPNRSSPAHLQDRQIPLPRTLIIHPRPTRPREVFFRTRTSATSNWAHARPLLLPDRPRTYRRHAPDAFWPLVHLARRGPFGKCGRFERGFWRRGGGVSEWKGEGERAEKVLAGAREGGEGWAESLETHGERNYGSLDA
jgi:hypothetical protein